MPLETHQLILAGIAVVAVVVGLVWLLGYWTR